MAGVTSTSATSTGSLLRITGMASGLDVDAMVKKMLTSDQYKIDKTTQNDQTIQWKKDAYNDIIKSVKDLQSSFFDAASPTTSLLSSSAYSAFDVNMVPVTTTAATITAGVGAQVGTYAISFKNPVSNVVDGSLAQAAGVSSSTKIMINASTLATNTTKLSDLGVAAASYTITVAYKNVDGVAQSKDIKFKEDSTLNDITNSINTTTGNSVKARYSELTGKLSIQTSTTGALTHLSITGDATVLSKLNLGDGSTTSANEATASYKIEPSDANVYITTPGAASGTLVTRTSNNFTVDGISYSLNDKVDSSFTVIQDSQKVYDKISSFLDKYNLLVDKIQTKIAEQKDKNYPPLTDAQKTSMSATDIVSWNTKAQVGLLRNDNNLANILTDLRSAFTSSVKDPGGSDSGLSFGQYATNSIGIDTSNDYSQGGKITIADKTKLMNAISEHSDQIMKFFTNSSSDTNTTTKFNESGVFTRMSDIITKNVGYVGTSLNSSILTKYANYQDDYSTTGGSGTNTLPDQSYYQKLLITQLTKNYKDDQDKYYLQFSTLETAMNNLNNQQSQLTSMLGTHN